MTNYDVCVIGNGILGNSLAFHLAQKNPSLKIALIGPKSRYGSASLAAAAMLNVWCELSNNHFEDIFLKKRFELTRMGGEKWSAFASSLSKYGEMDLQPKWGTYLIKTCKSTQIEEKSFSYVLKSLKENNIAHKKVDPSELPWLKATQGYQATDAIYVESDGRIDSREVLKCFDKVLEKLKIDVIDGEAQELKIGSKSFLFKDKNLHEIITKNSKILAKNVVLANGAYAQNLIDQIPDLAKSMPRLLYGIGSGMDITIPDWVKKYGGLGKEIMQLDDVIRTTDRGGACGVHLVPYGDGKFYAGASSLTAIEPDLSPKLHATHFLLDSLMNEINRSFFHSSISFRGIGCRPTSADTFPMIGETNISGIWLLNGTKRDGFTMSAYIAEELAKNILGEKHSLPEEFKPCRKIISYKNKEKAICDAELMYIGADFQHGAVQAPYMVDSYLQMRRNSIEKVYDQRNLGDFGIHPELIHLYENDEFYNKIKQQ